MIMKLDLQAHTKTGHVSSARINEKKMFDENPQKYSKTACDLTIEPGGAPC
jgi:hypothetical protein